MVPDDLKKTQLNKLVSFEHMQSNLRNLRQRRDDLKDLKSENTQLRLQIKQLGIDMSHYRYDEQQWQY
jgi:hypothetical protein